MSIKQILREYDFTNFDFQYKVPHGKTIEVKSWWGSYDTYLNLTKKLRTKGYTVIE